ncbi:20193_t:CDS:2, partial [Funneliformis geosporum]
QQAAALGITGLIVAPIILTLIIKVLGFGTGGIAANSFASWLMSLYGGSVGSGSILSFLQSVGAVGLGTAGTFISSSVGAAVGILIGAAGGNMLAKYFNEMDLNEYEQQIFENFIQIEEIAISNDHNMIIALMPALLYNELMLKCFIETFISSSPFLNSKLFKFYFKDDLLKLKSEKEKFNDLLISNFEESRVEKIWIKGEVFGYELDLNDYRPSNGMINLLAEVWYQINTNKDRKSEFFHKVKELSAPIFSPFKDNLVNILKKNKIDGLRLSFADQASLQQN